MLRNKCNRTAKTEKGSKAKITEKKITRNHTYRMERPGFTRQVVTLHQILPKKIMDEKPRATVSAVSVIRLKIGWVWEGLATQNRSICVTISEKKEYDHSSIVNDLSNCNADLETITEKTNSIAFFSHWNMFIFERIIRF